MEAPQLSAVEKSKLYSDQLNRFLTFKNKMDVPAQAPVQRTSLVSSTPVSAEIPPQAPPYSCNSGNTTTSACYS
jgi:hypothetical protein